MAPHRTVLVIDDDPLILDTARRLLEREGITVAVYSQGFNATNFAAKVMPDLILLDVNMPFLSGDSLALLFRRHPLLSSVPLVLFSSNEESALREMARAVGAIGAISKSDMADSLTRQVLRWLEQTAPV